MNEQDRKEITTIQLTFPRWFAAPSLWTVQFGLPITTRVRIRTSPSPSGTSPLIWSKYSLVNAMSWSSSGTVERCNSFTLVPLCSYFANLTTKVRGLVWPTYTWQWKRRKKSQDQFQNAWLTRNCQQYMWAFQIVVSLSAIVIQLGPYTLLLNPLVLMRPTW